MTPYDLEDYLQLARTHKAMTALIVSLKILSHYVSSNINRYWSEYFVLRQMKMMDVLFDIMTLKSIYSWREIVGIYT